MSAIPVKHIYTRILEEGEEHFNYIQYPINILYDDGVVVSCPLFSNLYYDYYLLTPFMQAYPNFPIKAEYSIQHYLQSNSYHTSTHLEILQKIIHDLDQFGFVNFLKNDQKEKVYAVFMQSVEQLYNALARQSKRYSLSIDIVDFMEIEANAETQKAIQLDTVDHQAIYQAYDNFFKVIKGKEGKLPNNQILKFFKSKTVNLNQLLQCMVYRGYVTEVDGSILPNPVLSNYLRGLYNTYDFMAESRTAAKALYFSEAPLQDAEYFARRLQLLTTVVESIDSEEISDCGTTDYMLWHIKPEQIDDTGRQVFPGDLKFLVGKYYLDEDTGMLKELTSKDHHLVGKVVKFRSLMHCKHPNKKTVCATCFGALHKNVSRFANIGHLCAATMTQQSSQSVLSTKHLDVSSVSNRILLTDKASQYLIINKNNEIFIRKEFRRNLYSLVIDKDSAPALLDIFAMENIENINPRRISNIFSIEFRVKKQNEIIGVTLPLAKYSKSFMLSYALLRYIKEKGYRVDKNNNFEFNMSDWDFDEAIMKYPEKEYSYSDHSKQISKIIENAVIDAMEDDSVSPTSVLQELFMLVNSKLKVNIVCLEVIVYAASIYSRNNFDLSRHSAKPVMGKADTTIRRRSLSGAYAYQTHIKTMTSPHSFKHENRPDSVMDVFVAPAETVAARKRKGLR